MTTEQIHTTHGPGVDIDTWPHTFQLPSDEIDHGIATGSIDWWPTDLALADFAGGFPVVLVDENDERWGVATVHVARVTTDWLDPSDDEYLMYAPTHGYAEHRPNGHRSHDDELTFIDTGRGPWDPDSTCNAVRFTNVVAR